MLVRFAVAVDKQSLRIAALPAPSGGIGEPLADFDRASLVLLPIKNQSRTRQVRMTVLPISFVVARHAADKKVEQERFLCVGGAIEHVQFLVRMGDDNLLVVFRFFVLLEQFRDTEFLQENAHVLDLVGECALGVPMLALRHGLLPEPAHVSEQDLLVVSAFVEPGDSAMLHEGIDRSSIFADALGIKTTGFAIFKVFLGSGCQLEPASVVRQNDSAFRRTFAAEPVEFVERQPLLALPLRL